MRPPTGNEPIGTVTTRGSTRSRTLGPLGQAHQPLGRYPLGLGLEIHEPPRMGPTSVGRLKAGQVVTVEPGLYYPGVGGVRLEDVAFVTNNGARNLTHFEKVLEL